MMKCWGQDKRGPKREGREGVAAVKCYLPSLVPPLSLPKPVNKLIIACIHLYSSQDLATALVGGLALLLSRVLGRFPDL